MGLNKSIGDRGTRTQSLSWGTRIALFPKFILPPNVGDDKAIGHMG